MFDSKTEQEITKIYENLQFLKNMNSNFLKQTQSINWLSKQV